METDLANEQASVLKALGLPTRLQIVAELLNGTKCVTDMEDILPASQANISQHLAVLRHANIVDFAQMVFMHGGHDHNRNDHAGKEQQQEHTNHDGNKEAK